MSNWLKSVKPNSIICVFGATIIALLIFIYQSDQEDIKTHIDGRFDRLEATVKANTISQTGGIQDLKRITLSELKTAKDKINDLELGQTVLEVLVSNIQEILRELRR